MDLLIQMHGWINFYMDELLKNSVAHWQLTNTIQPLYLRDRGKLRSKLSISKVIEPKGYVARKRN